MKIVCPLTLEFSFSGSWEHGLLLLVEIIFIFISGKHCPKIERHGQFFPIVFAAFSFGVRWDKVCLPIIHTKSRYPIYLLWNHEPNVVRICKIIPSLVAKTANSVILTKKLKYFFFAKIASSQNLCWDLTWEIINTGNKYKLFY